MREENRDLCYDFFPSSAITPLFTSLFSTLSHSHNLFLLAYFFGYLIILQNSQVTETA